MQNEIKPIYLQQIQKINNMKKLLFIFTALLLAGIANAQSNKEEIDYDPVCIRNGEKSTCC